MKNRAATTHIRQLCSLGLGGEAIMPALCAAMHQVIPSYAANFLWAGDDGEIENMYCEYHLPKVVELYMSEYDKFKGDLPDFAESIRSGRMTHLRETPKGFFQSETYNLIYRPYGFHHALGGTPRDAGRGLGGMVLYRRPQDPEFTDDEEREMSRLMRYVAHGLVRRSDQEDTFVDGPSRGLLIMNRAGVVIHVSAGAREMLYLATHAKVGPKEMHKSKTYVAVPPMLKLLCENLVDTFEGKPAEPPVFHHQNGWGRFTFRAYWLESVGVNDSGLIGVTVEQAEPQTLRIVRNMQALPLSPKQKEVCLLVATGHGNDEVAHRLNVSVTTVRDHLSKIYDKFAVHDRKDLILALAVDEDPDPDWYPSQRSSTSY